MPRLGLAFNCYKQLVQQVNIAMAKYQKVVERITRLIERQQLQPGAPLPSERDLARRFGVAYGTVRLANDFLIRQGVIERQQGRGTFVAQPVAAPAPVVKQEHSQRRLGLLSVEMGAYESPYLRAMIFHLQRLVQNAGYELIVEQLEIEQLVQGKLPRMVRRASVDGIFVYGRVRQHHIRFLEEQPLPFVLVGNRPVEPTVPQVRIDAQGMGYQITRALLQAGRDPVWFDADPANTDYQAGQEMLRGHTQALHEIAGPGAPLHLCSVRMQRVDGAAEQLLASDLRHSAFIVQDWAASLLMVTLAMRDLARLRQLLVVPVPFDELTRQVQGPNVMQWEGQHDVNDLAVPAVRVLLDRVEGRSTQVASVQINFECQLLGLTPEPRMRCRSRVEPYVPSPIVPAEPVGWA